MRDRATVPEKHCVTQQPPETKFSLDCRSGGDLPGEWSDIPLRVYFFATIINRPDHATSKNRMSWWLPKTNVPELLNVDASNMTGKNLWLAEKGRELIKLSRWAGRDR